MATSGSGVMQNELTMTQAAVGAFSTAVSDLQSIYNQVTDAVITLNGAMISTSSTLFQNGVGQWTDDFNALKGNLQSITDQLSQQISQMQANENNNVALTNSVSSIGSGVAITS